MFTIYSPMFGCIGRYATANDAQVAIRYLPYSVRQQAMVSTIKEAA